MIWLKIKIAKYTIQTGQKVSDNLYRILLIVGSESESKYFTKFMN